MKDMMLVEDDRFLKALLSVPEPSAIKIAPDGRFLVWSWSGLHDTQEIYLAPSDGGQAPQKITEGPGDKFALEWFPDGTALLVAVTHDGDEKIQLFRLDIADRHLTPLTPADPAYYIMGGTLHPTQPWLFYAANRDPKTGDAMETTAIYRQDLKTGELWALAQTQKSLRVAPKLSPSGEWLIYRSRDRHRDGRQLWIVSAEMGGDAREWLNLGDQVKLFGHWHPDRDQVVVVAESAGNRKVGLGDLSGNVTWLVDDSRKHISGAYWPDRSSYLVVCHDDDARAFSMMVDDTGRIVAEISPGDGSTMTPVGPLTEGKWAAIWYRADQPMDIVSWIPGTDGAPQSLSKLWDRVAIKPSDLAVPQSLHWNSAGGLRIQGWFYRAHGQAKGTIVHVHGGPTYHYENMFYSLSQYLVAAGFNVFEPNYRGSTGFGLDFQDAVKKDGWGGMEQIDIRTGIEYLIATGLAVPGRIGMTGVSYGGYSSWWAITHFPKDLVAAAAPVCGMTDLVVDYETTRPDLRGYSEEMMGGTPQEVPDRYRERSPIHVVDRIKGRLLIVQGLTDPNVTPENVRAVEAALANAKITYEKLTFDDEGHGIHKPSNQAILYRRLKDFFLDNL